MNKIKALAYGLNKPQYKTCATGKHIFLLALSSGVLRSRTTPQTRPACAFPYSIHKAEQLPYTGSAHRHNS